MTVFHVGDKVRFRGQIIKNEAVSGGRSFHRVVSEKLDSKGNRSLEYFDGSLLGRVGEPENSNDVLKVGDAVFYDGEIVAIMRLDDGSGSLQVLSDNCDSEGSRDTTFFDPNVVDPLDVPEEEPPSSSKNRKTAFKVGDKVKFAGTVYCVVDKGGDRQYYDIVSEKFDYKGNRATECIEEELLEIDGIAYDRQTDRKTKFRVGDKVKYVGEIIELTDHGNGHYGFRVLSVAIDCDGDQDIEYFDESLVDPADASDDKFADYSEPRLASKETPAEIAAMEAVKIMKARFDETWEQNRGLFERNVELSKRIGEIESYTASIAKEAAEAQRENSHLKRKLVELAAENQTLREDCFAAAPPYLNKLEADGLSKGEQ